MLATEARVFDCRGVREVRRTSLEPGHTLISTEVVEADLEAVSREDAYTRFLARYGFAPDAIDGTPTHGDRPEDEPPLSDCVPW